MPVQMGAKPLNRQFKLYSFGTSATAISDATNLRPDSYSLDNLTLQKTIYGYIEDVASDEFFSTQKVIQPRAVLVTCRWFAGLDTKWLLYFDEKMFEIISAREIGTRQLFEIRAKMTIGKTTIPSGGPGE